MPTITLSPIPPKQGQQATICYTGGTLPATLQLSWTPPNAGPATIEIGLDGCADIIMPTNATSIAINDEEGGADEESSVIAAS
jgi:hypothetical protein